MIVLPLSQISENHISTVGKKAYSLAQLVQGKFPVPEAFVVSSEAFSFFLQESDIGVTIQSELSKVRLDDLHSIDYASRLLQDLIGSAPMPSELQTVIMQQFAHIPSQYVAVRSSAFSEEHLVAWSGELDTYLQVTAVDLSQKIKACWASLFSTRSLYYFIQQQLDISTVNIAVIVQRMIDAEASGLAYSMHPVTQDPHQVVIEAEFGLGDANESGQITPDTYVVNETTQKILDKNIHTQDIVVEPQQEGTKVKEVDESKKTKQKISDEQILQLTKEVKSIEAFLGHPVDVEWVYAEERFSYLQTRELKI